MFTPNGASAGFVSLVVAALVGSGCGSASSSASRAMATAATVAAIEVAAAAVSKSTYGCYTTCGFGTECNPKSGLCEPREPCNSGDPACGKTPAYVEATRASGAPGGAEADAPLDESCAGFCLSTERCVVYRGDLDCVPR